MTRGSANIAIVHARGLARCLNSRAARCVYETAVRNGKARGHKLPLSQRKIDKFYPIVRAALRKRQPCRGLWPLEVGGCLGPIIATLRRTPDESIASSPCFLAAKMHNKQTVKLAAQ